LSEIYCSDFNPRKLIGDLDVEKDLVLVIEYKVGKDLISIRSEKFEKEQEIVGKEWLPDTYSFLFCKD